jgi:ABC-2 type transport system permease protein
MIVPIAIFYVGLGLLCGSVFNVKQVGGICGALLTNLSAWLSGVWFDLELIGGTFSKIANLLPFIHAVELERAMINGIFSESLSHLYPVLGYAVVIMVGAILLFLRKARKQ